MSAVFIRDRSVIASLLKEREERGLDRLDEVWEGVLHMSPPPHFDHQEIVTWLGEVLRVQARRYALGKVCLQAGVREPGTPPHGKRANYRVPDVVLIPPERTKAASESGWIEDGARLVIEVRSPREEFLEKLAFYADRGLEEALWVDRVTRERLLFRRATGGLHAVHAGPDGALEIKTAYLRMFLDDGVSSLRFEDAKGAGPLPSL